MTPNDTGGDDASTPIETGVQWLTDRTEAAIARLTSIEIARKSVIFADDVFFHPIRRTVSQDVCQLLLSALDHLRFLAWSLRKHEKTYPYAQATLIRTAATGAATALWIVGAESTVERRCRAMEFMFNDIKSHLTWMATAAAEPMHQQRPASEWTAYENQRSELQRRQEWLVQQANTLLQPETAFTRRTYGQRLTSDSDMVRAAGTSTPAIGVGGWDPELVLLSSWQVLSGYAHARPWAVPLGSTLVVNDPEPNPTTGTISVTPEGNPDRLLDMAFRALLVAENAVARLESLSVA
ncbi:hypothetical protein [Mycobacterium kyogaense]|uniref:hypothetical protein n=1 Tax=Mycobacterium kyogaense TaxID=2212479 RepID=UPI000DAC238B|nr:hypothetical protein [Mycobacterium kyogaense]